MVGSGGLPQEYHEPNIDCEIKRGFNRNQLIAADTHGQFEITYSCYDKTNDVDYGDVDIVLELSDADLKDLALQIKTELHRH
jgi:hypothetical protein